MSVNPILWVILLLVGSAAGYLIRQFVGSKRANSVEEKIRRELEESRSKAKGVILEAQEKATALLEEVKKEERETKS